MQERTEPEPRSGYSPVREKDRGRTLLPIILAQMTCAASCSRAHTAVIMHMNGADDVSISRIVNM